MNLGEAVKCIFIIVYRPGFGKGMMHLLAEGGGGRRCRDGNLYQKYTFKVFLDLFILILVSFNNVP